MTEEQRRKKAEEELWIKNNPHTSVAEMFYPSMRESTRRYNEHKELEESIVRNQQEYNLANFIASELLYPSMRGSSADAAQQNMYNVTAQPVVMPTQIEKDVAEGQALAKWVSGSFNGGLNRMGEAINKEIQTVQTISNQLQNTQLQSEQLGHLKQSGALHPDYQETNLDFHPFFGKGTLPQAENQKKPLSREEEMANVSEVFYAQRQQKEEEQQVRKFEEEKQKIQSILRDGESSHAQKNPDSVNNDAAYYLTGEYWKENPFSEEFRQDFKDFFVEPATAFSAGFTSTDFSKNMGVGVVPIKENMSTFERVSFELGQFVGDNVESIAVTAAVSVGVASGGIAPAAAVAVGLFADSFVAINQKWQTMNREGQEMTPQIFMDTMSQELFSTIGGGTAKKFIDKFKPIVNNLTPQEMGLLITETMEVLSSGAAAFGGSVIYGDEEASNENLVDSISSEGAKTNADEIAKRNRLRSR